MDDSQPMIISSLVFTEYLKASLGDLDISTYDLLQSLIKTIPLIGTYEYQQRSYTQNLIKIAYCSKNSLIKVWINEVVALILNKSSTVEFTKAYLELSPQQFQRLMLEVLRLKGYTKTSTLNKSMTQSWLCDPCVPAKFIQLVIRDRYHLLLQQVYAGLRIEFDKKSAKVTSTLRLNKSQENTVNAIADLIKTYCWLNKKENLRKENLIVNFTLTAPIPDVVIDCSFVPYFEEQLFDLIKSQGYSLNKPLIGLRVELNRTLKRDCPIEDIENNWSDKVLTSVFLTKELQELVGLIRQVINQHKPTPLSESSLAVAVIYQHSDDVIDEAEYTAKAIHYGLLQPS